MRTETEVSVEAAEETEETTSVGGSVTLNGEEYDAAAAESLWQMVSALAISGSAEASAGGEALLTLRAANESGVSGEFSFHEYDADNYLVVGSDDSAFLSSADSIDKLIRNLRQL